MLINRRAVTGTGLEFVMGKSRDRAPNVGIELRSAERHGCLLQTKSHNRFSLIVSSASRRAPSLVYVRSLPEADLGERQLR